MDRDEIIGTPIVSDSETRDYPFHKTAKWWRQVECTGPGHSRRLGVVTPRHVPLETSMDTSGQSICPSTHLLLWAKEEGLGTRGNGRLRHFDIDYFISKILCVVIVIDCMCASSPFPLIFPGMRISP